MRQHTAETTGLQSDDCAYSIEGNLQCPAAMYCALAEERERESVTMTGL